MNEEIAGEEIGNSFQCVFVMDGKIYRVFLCLRKCVAEKDKDDRTKMLDESITVTNRR